MERRNLAEAAEHSGGVLRISATSTIWKRPLKLTEVAPDAHRGAVGPSPHQGELGLRGARFRGHLCVHFRYGPMTRSPSKGWLCQ